MLQGEQSQVKVNSLAEKWAPLVWLASDEKYFPLSVEEFLQHVDPIEKDGRIISGENMLPVGRTSKSLYLIPKKGLNILKDNTSFLNGRNPLNASVPVYVTISDCSRSPTPPFLNSFKYSWNKLGIFTKVHAKDMAPNAALKKPSFLITYWMFYPYNEGKKLCFLGKLPAPLIFNKCIGKQKPVGNHIGDFEHISFAFDENFAPQELFLALHDIGIYYTYDPVSKIFINSGYLNQKGITQTSEFPSVVRTLEGRPILFAAKGSHGFWSAPGNIITSSCPSLRISPIMVRRGRLGNTFRSIAKITINLRFG
ncbi:protein eva-1 [Holotrichia oblita]|uniref:Protein eva-1 n=1 Tax=Holotrichia oblita TaxID=644536 RepID=A0ACB9SVL2_HOLOL|nr:protein eva-1 [Holotrichia oblita]